ncbi:MAG TPA: inorganic pyrophosphatase, partial [Saprospirales bacterium]|nr:inorganic pyrophosphatase [Saprospirales bacterium]
KTVVVEEFQNREVAMKVVEQAIKDYDAKFGDRD